MWRPRAAARCISNRATIKKFVGLQVLFVCLEEEVVEPLNGHAGIEALYWGTFGWCFVWFILTVSLSRRKSRMHNSCSLWFPIFKVAGNIHQVWPVMCPLWLQMVNYSMLFVCRLYQTPTPTQVFQQLLCNISTTRKRNLRWSNFYYFQYFQGKTYLFKISSFIAPSLILFVDYIRPPPPPKCFSNFYVIFLPQGKEI